MKKNSRLAAWLLSMTLLLGLCACGTDTPVSSDTAAMDSAAPESKAVQTEEPAPANTPETAVSTVDSIQEPEAEAPGSLSYPLEGEHSFSVWTPFQTRLENVITGYGDWVSLQLAEEQTGVHIEWINIPQNQAFEQFSLMVASDDYADMCRGFSGFYSNGVEDAYEQGIILDLTELIAENMPAYNAALDRNAQYRRDLSTDDGMMLYVNTVQTENYTMNGNVIRQDWLDALQLSMPETMDELEQVLLAFQSKYGVSNALLVNQGNYGSILSQGFNTRGVPERGDSYYVENGQVKCGLTDENLKSYVRTMHRFYEEGLFDSDFVSRSSNPKDPNVIQMIATGETGVFNTSIGIWTTITEASADPAMKLAAMPVVMEQTGDVTHFYDQYQIGSGSVSLFYNCKEPEIACQWLDWFYTEAGSLAMCYGIEGESYTINDQGKPQWNEVQLETLAQEYSTTTSTIAEFYYGIKGNFVALVQSDCLFEFYTDDMLQGIEVYGDPAQYGDNWNFSNYMSLSSQDSASVATVKTDIATYATTEITKFIIGEEDVDAQWDSYVAAIEAMGVQDVIAVYQDCYDTFSARK